MEKLYLVLVKEDDLRLFTSCPKKVKEPIMIESEEEEQDYYGHFYHPKIESGKYKEVWKSGYEEGIRVSPSIFSKELQNLITLDKVLDIYKVINMTREDAQDMLPIIKAYSEGNPIQYRIKDNKSAKWNDVNKNYHEFSPHSFQYRIKPEFKYRPFKDADECWQEMLKHTPFGWIKSKNGTTTNKFMFINALKNDGISICVSVDFSYSDSIKYYTFVDGTPFGIKIE